MNEVSNQPSKNVGDIGNMKEFWELADELLYTKLYYDETTKEYITSWKQTETTESEINTLLVSYIALISKYREIVGDHLGEVCAYLLDIESYQKHREFCLRKMLSLLIYSVDCNLNNLELNCDVLGGEILREVNESISMNEQFINIIGCIMIKEHERDNQLMNILKEYQGFTVLSKVVRNYAAITKRTGDIYTQNYSPYLILWFDLCKDNNFVDEIDNIYEDEIIFLFDKLKVETRIEDEVNYIKFRLLLILNEQYVYQCGLKVQNGKKTNLVVYQMVRKIQYFQTFTEILVLNFNREMDTIDQILMMKYLYVVFSNEKTNRLVYLNDVKIIVDIIIRQLYDIPIKASSYIMDIYLRVLKCMLTKTNLRRHSYKREELVAVLEYLRGEDVNEHTRRLIDRCLQCSFFNPLTYANTQDNRSEELLPIRKVTPLIPPERSHSLPQLVQSPQPSPPSFSLPPPPPPPPSRLRGRESSVSSLSTSSSQTSGQGLSRLSSAKPPPPPPPPARTTSRRIV